MAFSYLLICGKKCEDVSGNETSRRGANEEGKWVSAFVAAAAAKNIGNNEVEAAT